MTSHSLSSLEQKESKFQEFTKEKKGETDHFYGITVDIYFHISINSSCNNNRAKQITINVQSGLLCVLHKGQRQFKTRRDGRRNIEADFEMVI